MAKRKVVLSLQDMEKELGYTVNRQGYDSETSQRFYSDLSLVPEGARDRTERELEERTKRRYDRCNDPPDDGAVGRMRPGAAKELRDNEDVITITRTASCGFFVFSADIQYGFGYELPLLLTYDETARTLHTANLVSSASRDNACAFFRLPRELRDKIYDFSIPSAKWRLEEVEIFDRCAFPRALGDPTGFYFPLSKSVTVLKVNKQMRREAISLAYRKTLFELDDMDDLVKFLMAIGRIGRENIEALQFPWISRADSERRWDEISDPERHFMTLPILHVSRCVSLLQQCKKLRALRLVFENELMTTMSLSTFMADPGIRSLSRIGNIEAVEIWNLQDESLEHSSLAAWLKEKLEG